MYAYIIQPKDLQLNTTGKRGIFPLVFSVSPLDKQGMPMGLIALDGSVYRAKPDNLPILISYADGGMEILETFDVNLISHGGFAVSGSAMLIRHGQVLALENKKGLRPIEVIDRIGIATLNNGTIFVVCRKCTLLDLQETLRIYGAYDAMMGAYGDVYMYNPRGGVDMGNIPVTTLQAKAYQDLPRPVVVIDPGHGGSDPGAVGLLGLLEKNLNLFGASIVRKYLTDNYNGTFVLTRDSDVTVSLTERCNASNALNADFFYSCHSNSFGNPEVSGYESFVYPGASATTQAIQNSVHTEAMGILSLHETNDRGKQQKNLQVLRNTKCPALLTETLFVSNEGNAQILSNTTLLTAIYTAQAIGLAKGLGLTKKVVTTSPVASVDTRLYRVQVGAFQFKAGADETLSKLKQAGFNGYVTRG